MLIKEISTTPPLTPDQQKIEVMKLQIKNSQKAVKAEKARQKIQSGQKELSKSFFS